VLLVHVLELGITPHVLHIGVTQLLLFLSSVLNLQVRKPALDRLFLHAWL